MELIEVATDVGPGRMLVAAAETPRALLLLGHGAGGGLNSFDLDALADSLPARGITVARFEQPWKTAGRRVAGPPAGLDKGWAGALAWVAASHPGLPLVVGGRSAGARVACRCFAPPALGVVCLSFPLHLPGKPQNSRIAELAGVDGPVLIFQGTADPFGSGDEVLSALQGHPTADGVTIIDLPGTHSFGPRTAAARAAAGNLRDRFVDTTEAFITEVVG